jgi:hypothetical protein
MSKFNLAEATKNLQVKMSRNAPAILTGVGIIGMVGTTIMAVKATPKALKSVEAKKNELQEEKLHPIEVIKVTWKYYIPAAVTGVTSAACLIRANSISTRRNAALVTAYNLSKTAFAEYKDKVIETIGENKEQVVRDKIAQDKVDKDPVSSNEVIITNGGQTLCYDGVFGRYFYSDRDSIQRAANRINRKLNSYMYVSLNEFYNELGLNRTDIGDLLGWKSDDGEVEIFFSTTIAEDGRPALVMSFNIVPEYDFDKIV